MPYKPKNGTLWCDHCGTDIKLPAVIGCLRRTCVAKAELQRQQKDTDA